MSENSEEHGEVYNRFLELRQPTEEDFKRVFTEEELKELCLKHKCVVDIWRWNVVDDYRVLFTQSGRYQKWSERDRLRMLAKAVNKIKPQVYEDEEIKKIREKEWGLQLKDNILSLNYWKRQREKQSVPLLSQSDDVDQVLQAQCDVSTESIDTSDLFTQSEEHVNISQDELSTQSIHVNTQNLQNSVKNLSNSNETHNEIYSNVQINTESMNGEEMNMPSLESLESRPKKEEIAQMKNMQSDEERLLIKSDGDDSSLGSSDDSVDTIIFDHRPKETMPETLHSEEVAPEIADIYGINTMSMTVDSQMSTQSQALPMLQSEEVIATDYNNFINIIPLTSTQSQSQEYVETILS